MNSFQGELRVGQPQKKQMHPIPILSQPGYQGCLTAPRQGRLESEIDAGPGERLDPLQHEPSGLDGQALRIEGREAGGDQVGVDEFLAVRIVRKEQTGEGALARAVRTRDDIDVRWTFLSHWRHDSTPDGRMPA